MSKTTLLGFAVAGLLLVNLGIITFLLFRQPPPPHHPEGRPPFAQEGPKNIIIDLLHFDQEQVAAYEMIIHQHRDAVQTLEDSIRITKNLLYQTLTSDDIHGKDSLINQLGVFQRQMELTHYTHFAAIRKICKPAQVEDFNRLTKELARFFAPGKKDGPPPRD